MKLKLNDARYGGVFNDYFGKIDDIAEYNKTIKLERIDAMRSLKVSLRKTFLLIGICIPKIWSLG